MLRRGHRNDAKQRGRFLLDGDPLPLHLIRQARQRDLHAVVDIDGIDIGVGAELERADQSVAAIVTADAFHVDHLVDADHLGFDRLGNRGIDNSAVAQSAAKEFRYALAASSIVKPTTT